jgi:hypothetical protein
MLTIFPLLAIAQASPSAGDGPDNSTAVEPAGKTSEMLPLLNPTKKEERGGLGQLWQFLFAKESGRRSTPLKQSMLKPDTLVLRQVKQEYVEQRLAIGSSGSTLARFAIPSQRHLQGALLSGKVFNLAPAQITLSTVYLEGQSGLVTTPRLELSHDRAWSIGTDIGIFSDRLQLYGEYARTRHNSNPLAVTPVQEDDAYKLQLSYQPLQTVSFLDTPLNWTLGVKHKQVGPLFQSPAGPTEKQGVLLWEGSTHLDWQGLVLDASVLQEINHIDNSRPLQQIHRTQVRGQYQFPKSELPWWLGAPSFGMNLSEENNEKSGIQVSVASFEADFSYQNWDWNLSHRLNWSEDNTMKVYPGHRGVTIAEAKLKLFNNSLSLAPVFRYQHPNANFDANQIAIGVGTRAVFIPEWLDGQLRVDAQQDWNRKRLKHTYSTSGDLSWQLTRRKTQAPAVRLFLEGRYQAMIDQVNNFTESYRVLLGITLN